MEQPRLPEKWNDWKILEKVGEGSYGTVYKAERRIGKESLFSAIKIIRIPKEDAEVREVLRILGKESVQTYYLDLVEDYIREIQAMERLQGITNIVSIQDYVVEELKDRIGWIVYIRMEFLTSFTEYLVTHQMEEPEVVKLGIDLCTALEFCEKTKIIHRDIKPENIFYSELGNFKLGDFGIARKMDRSLSVYSSKGTFSYMAPEVYRGEQYDQRADIYSLGLVMYRLLNANREPFLPKDRQMVYYKDREEALQRRMSGEAPDPPADCSAGLSRIILKTIAADPEERYSNADALKKELEQYQRKADTVISAQPAIKETAEVSEKKTDRKRMFFIVGIAALLLIGCLIFYLNKGNNATTEVDQEPVTEVIKKAAQMVQTEETDTEPIQAEELQTETVYTEPIQTESVHTETAHTETAYTETAQAETAQAETTQTETTQTEMAQTETVQTETTPNVSIQTEVMQTETKNFSEEESTEIDITDCAGFVIRPSGKIVRYYYKKKLIQLLVEEAGLQETDTVVLDLAKELKNQFVLEPRGNYQRGDVITMRYQPKDTYLDMLKEIDCAFKYRGKSKAYQGDQEDKEEAG